MSNAEPSLYTFTDYSSEWPKAFEREASTLRHLLGDEAIEIHHIGSTSVPGLAAKPVIDLLPVVRRIEWIDESASAFEDAGYRAWGEFGLPGRRCFTRDDGRVRTHNVHIYERDNPEVERHVAFRSYLREHPAVRDEYAELKRAVYAKHPADIEAYNEGKNDWIRRVEREAIEWFRRGEDDTSAR